MKNKRFIRPILVTGLILLIPLVAMQFTNEVDWDLFDFIVMGILLLTTGAVLELLMKKISNSTCRVIAVIAILIVFSLIWAELAVGIFGTQWAGS